VSAPPHAGNRFLSRAARDSLLREAGVHPSMAMTPKDRDLADHTPIVAARSLSTLFGGTSRNERPQSREGNILCINREAQPYAPLSPGKSGLVFRYPGVVLLEDICETFHLFFNKRSTEQIRYLGTYTKVPIVHATVEKEEWLSLPGGVSGVFFQHFSRLHPACQAVSDSSLQCRKAWTRRVHSSTKTDVREAHARISLRKQSQDGPPPSTDDIREWPKQTPKREGIRQVDVTSALSSGEEVGLGH
jgi:hypothetical protein